jgi:tetratricopeptide (TPR) repeat protein
MNRRFVGTVVLLLSLVTTAASAGEKPWIEVRSPHFRVLTDASQSDARQIAHEFEAMRFVFSDRYPQFRLEGGAPLLIFAARDEGTARSLDPGTWKAKGVKPNGFFNHAWDKEYAMVRMDGWNEPGNEAIGRVIVYHEYTHSILHLNLHWIPGWLNEGLANYYGYTRFERNRILIGAPPPRSVDMPTQFLIPIETLISGSPDFRDEVKVLQFYAESWALVHFMMWGPGMERGERLNKFSSLLQQGIEQKKAFQQAFGSFADVDKALALYVSNRGFATGVLTTPLQIDDKNFTTRTLTMAETEAELSGFHFWTHDVAGARSLAEKALKDDAKLGLAHEMMGFVDFADAKDADALNEFSQAYSLDSTLWLSLFAKTMMSPIATSTAPADEDALKLDLLKVVELNQQFAPAYVQLARLALRRGELQTALGLSRRAEELEPTRAGYHTMSGQILLRMGKGSDAGAFAKYVAERWAGSDHNEAVELWNAIPAEQRPEGTLLPEALFKDTQTVEGRVAAARCSPNQKEFTLTIVDGDKTLTYRANQGFPTGFTDTIWYGADHFTFCHHLEGMRAVVRYKASSDPNYAGDLAYVEIRDDVPAAAPKDAAKEPAAPPPKP